MITVNVSEKPGRGRIKKIEVKRLVREIILSINSSPFFPFPLNTTEVSILFCDDSFIRGLNKDYRGKDKATDVLSFGMVESADEESSGEWSVGDRIESPILGDVVISLETAARQHEQFGTTYEEELVRLLVHGIHHLMGFEHEGVTKGIALKMKRSENSVFEKVRNRAVSIVGKF
jgi:probable rRNA maturation factor